MADDAPNDAPMTESSALKLLERFVKLRNSLDLLRELKIAHGNISVDEALVLTDQIVRERGKALAALASELAVRLKIQTTTTLHPETIHEETQGEAISFIRQKETLLVVPIEVGADSTEFES